MKNFPAAWFRYWQLNSTSLDFKLNRLESNELGKASINLCQIRKCSRWHSIIIIASFHSSQLSSIHMSFAGLYLTLSLYRSLKIPYNICMGIVSLRDCGLWIVNLLIGDVKNSWCLPQVSTAFNAKVVVVSKNPDYSRVFSGRAEVPLYYISCNLVDTGWRQDSPLLSLRMRSLSSRYPPVTWIIQ